VVQAKFRAVTLGDRAVAHMKNLSLKPWETLKRRRIFSDLPWIDLSVERVRIPNGKVVQNFYQVGLPEYAIVVAYTVDGHLVMERQYKHGARQVSLEFPAGYLELSEEPLRGAQRELLEETGYAAPTWYRLGSFVVDGNRGCGKAHMFMARGARKVRTPAVGDTEELEVLLMTPRGVRDALRKGDITLLSSALAAALAINPRFIPTRSAWVKSE